MPSRLNENKQILEQKQGKYNKLLTLRPTYEQLSVLKNDEIPRLRTSLEKTEASLKKTRKEVEELENDIYAPQTDEAICRSIQVMKCNVEANYVLANRLLPVRNMIQNLSLHFR